MASVSRETMEKPTSKPIGGHSTFLNGYPLAGSYRFGQIQPHFVQEVVPDDDIELSTAYKLDSYTLSQPLMQDMFITHGYYFVPWSALLPFNYDKLITNPVFGQDVDADKVGLSYSLSSITNLFESIASVAYSALELDVPDHDAYFSWILRYIVLWDMIFGLGGLPASLGYRFIVPEMQKTFENFLQFIRSEWAENGIEVAVRHSDNDDFVDYSDFHQVLEFIRDDFNFILQFKAGSGHNDDFIQALDSKFLSSDFDIDPSTFSWVDRYNMSRILSYQVLCAHFFTNDKIDYIYSAELYRQNVYSSVISFLDDLATPDELRFTLNGESYAYDYLSAGFFDVVFNYVSSATAVQLISVLQYLRLLFGFNYSLRHVDYFTGSRSHPLAVGDVGVRVNDNVVDVVDTIQTTWFAKFLNQVNRTGRRLSNYIKGLFPSTAISQDWHDPIWLGDTTDKIAGAENQNTASEQFENKNSITTNLNSNASKYGFRYHNTQYYGTIIGVVYFDIERFYQNVTERPIFHVDRFDIFNPFLQFNGDQPVYTKELSVGGDLNTYFGYQSRYLEYKQRVPQCFGAFEVDPVLNKSIFIADIEKVSDEYTDTFHIGPSYIRSHPLEFDKFYLSLTGLSLASYYHFQMIHWNRVKSVRPMVFNPQLG